MKRWSCLVLVAGLMGGCGDDSTPANPCDDPSSTDPSCEQPGDPCDDPSSTDPSCEQPGDPCDDPSSTDPSCEQPSDGCDEESETLCGALCVDVQSDAEHCGACGIVCVGRDVCSSGVCAMPPAFVSEPADGASNVETDTEIRLTFAEPFVPVDDWIALYCERSGTRTLSSGLSYVAEEGLSVVVTLDTPLLRGESCTADVLLQGGVGVDGLTSHRFTFSTTAPSLVLLDEGFDDVTAAETGALPEGWVAARGHSAAPATNVSFVHSAWVSRESAQDSDGGVVVSTSWFSPARQADEWLFTPPVVLPATGSCTVDWRALAVDSSFRDGYEVRVSTGDATIAAGLVDAPIFTTPAGEAEWSSLTASLDGYAGQTVRVAFRNNSDDKFLLYLDTIRIRCD